MNLAECIENCKERVSPGGDKSVMRGEDASHSKGDNEGIGLKSNDTILRRAYGSAWSQTASRRFGSICKDGF